MNNKSQPRMIYLEELISNLRWTSSKFREAISSEGQDQPVITFHLRRGRESLEISHAHLQQIIKLNEHKLELGPQSLPELNISSFSDSSYLSGFEQILIGSMWSLGYFLVGLLIIVASLIFWTVHSKLKSQSASVSGQLNEVDYRLEEVEELIHKSDRKTLAELFKTKRNIAVNQKTYQDAKLDWHCEKVELKALVDQLRRERDEAFRLKYINELIPVLLGARGDTPVQKLRSAIFGDIDFPVIGKERIQKFLGIPRPPPIEKFGVQEANQFTECFLPGTSPYGDIRWSFSLRDPPSKPRTSEHSVSLLSLPSFPSLSLDQHQIDPKSTSSWAGPLKGLSTESLPGFSSIWDNQRIDNWLSSELNALKSIPSSIDLDHKDMDASVSSSTEPKEPIPVVIEDLRSHNLEPPWTPPFVPRSVQGEIGWELNQYLNKYWYVPGALTLLKETNLKEDLLFHYQAKSIKDMPIRTGTYDASEPLYEHWQLASVKPSTTIQNWDSSVEIEVCPEFSRIAPTLRSIFTTDQDTECFRCHVADTVCGACAKRVLCHQRCFNCLTAIEMVLKANQLRVAPGNWTTFQVVDTLYYQLLGLAKYPAAEYLIFPAARVKSSPSDTLNVIDRRLEWRVSENQNRYYNEDCLCTKCGDIHVVASLKEPPEILFPIDQYAYDEPRPAIVEERMIQECPPKCHPRHAMGRYLCLYQWKQRAEFPHLQLAVLRSLKLSGWRTKEWPWAITKPNSDFGSWPSIFSGWKPDRAPKVRFCPNHKVIN